MFLNHERVHIDGKKFERALVFGVKVQVGDCTR